MMSYYSLISLAIIISLFSIHVNANNNNNNNNDLQFTDESTGEMIKLTKAKIYSTISHSFPSERLGLWPHGDSRENDAAFFNEEDAAYEKWAINKKKEKENTNNERNYKKNNKKDSTSNNNNNNNNKNNNKNNNEEGFSISAVKSRIEERRKYLKNIKNASSIEFAWNIIQADAERVLLLLSKDFISNSNNNNNNNNNRDISEEQYIRLLENVFSHTIRNITSEKKDSWVMELISALPYPIILDEEIFIRVEREVKSIKEDILMLEESVPSLNLTNIIKIDNNTINIAKKSIQKSISIIKASKRSHKMVITLTLPIISYARDSIMSQLREIEAKILANDESTNALRQELKELTKRKKLLTSTKEEIIRTDRNLRKARYSNKLLQKNTFIASLGIIARVRLGKITDIEIIDMIPTGDSVVTLTGALEKELKELLLFPLGHGIIISTLFTWVLLATRDFWLKRVRRIMINNNNNNKEGHRIKGTPFVLIGLRANLLIEAIVPLLIPAILLYRTLKSETEEVTLYFIIMFSQPSQRIFFIALAIIIFVISIIVSSLTGSLYKFLCNDKLQRKKRS